MINNIKYYYNIEVSNIEQVDDDYLFDNYILKQYYKELDINLYNYLVSNGVYLHKIIYNRFNEYVTNIDNTPYILLKIIKNEIINLSLISNYNIPLKGFFHFNWAELWAYKIDYYEKNASNIKDTIIKESFNYYIGMAENALNIYNRITLSDNFYLCHLRFKNNYDFYDPLNIIVDYKMRDYAEYIKKEFYIHNKYYYDFIKKIIYSNNYNDVMLFFTRMLYPSCFFDEYDNYIKKEKINYNFFYRKYEYEKYLKYIYKTIKTKYNIITIDWLQ